MDAGYAVSDGLFEEPSLGRVLAGAAFLLAATAGSFVIYGALVEVADAARAPAAAVRAPWTFHHRALTRAAPLVGAGLAASVTGAAGLLLCVVPGLFVLTRWSVPLQVIVLEGRSWRDSLARSSELVQGRGWPVLGWVVISLVSYLGISALAFEGLDGLPGWLRSWLSGYAVDITLFPFLAVAWTVMYSRLAVRGNAIRGAPRAT